MNPAMNPATHPKMHQDSNPQLTIAPAATQGNPRDQLMGEYPTAPTQNAQGPPILKPCPHCGVPATVTETLGEYKIECSNLIDCAAWPVTAWHPGLESAGHAWNSGITF